MTETISAAADRLNLSREQLRLWLLAANVYVPRSTGPRSPMVLDSAVIERVVAERRQRRTQYEEAERRRAEARATEEALPSLAERRAKAAERYRDETGACLTCQATAECSDFKKLVCRWCEEAEEASEVERDESEDEDE